MTDILDQSGNLATALVDRHIAATEGNQRALRYGEKNYSFHDLAALMNRAGNVMRTLGVESGQPVLIIIPPSPAFFAAILGAMKIGAIPIVPAETVTVGLLRGALAHAAPAAVLIDRARWDEFGPILRGLNIVVAGDAPDGFPSLVDMLREAPSSLSAAQLDNSAEALTILRGAGAQTVSHQRLAERLENGTPLGVGIAGGDLGDMMARLSRCEEITLTPNS
ncbi:MAG: AMP-binding protein [Candidatus Binataceae bacterium]